MSFLINGWRLDSSLNGITHADTAETKRLGEYQFALLSLLLEHPNQVLTREVLTQHAWKTRVVGHNSLPNAIHALRNALGDDGKQQQIIKTVPKKGYLLDGSFLSPDTQNQPPAPPAPLLAEDRGQSEVEIENGSENKEQVLNSEPEKPPSAYIPAPVAPSLPAQARNKHRRWAITLGALVAVVVVAAAWGWYAKKIDVSSSELQVKELPDRRFNAKHTQIFALQMPGDVSQDIGTKPISSDLQNQLTRLDTELEKRQAKMQMRYHLGVNVMSLNLSLTNRCNIHSQLLMDIHNWAQYSEKLPMLIYNESVRTLNDLPNCP